MTSLSLERYSKNSRPWLFLGKGVLKICSKFTGEFPCRSVISIKLLCNLIEIKIQHGCSSVNLLHIFRTTFPKNTSGRLLLVFVSATFEYHKMVKKENIKDENEDEKNSLFSSNQNNLIFGSVFSKSECDRFYSIQSLILKLYIIEGEK